MQRTIDAEDRADALESERRKREQVEKAEKVLDLSRRSRSRGALSEKSPNKDLKNNTMMKNTAKGISLVNVNNQRPQTAIVDPSKQLAQTGPTRSGLGTAQKSPSPSPYKNSPSPYKDSMANTGAMSSREELRAINKAKREAELRVVDMEQEKEEGEARRKEEASMAAKQRLVDRNRSRSQGRVSDLSSPVRGAGKFEDDD